jgi:chromosome segregation ATPase
LTAAKGGQTSIQNQITKQNGDITTATNTLNTLKTDLAKVTTNRENKEKAINTIKQQMADLTSKININDEASVDLNNKIKELQDQVSKGKLNAASFKTQMDEAKIDFEEHMGHLKTLLTLQTPYEASIDTAKTAVLGATPNLATFKDTINNIVA